MPSIENTIKCPECGSEINVSKALYSQLEEIKKEYEQKYESREKEISHQLCSIKNEKETLQKERDALDELVSDEVRKKLKTERNIIEEKLRGQIINDTREQLEALQKELNEKSGQLKEFNKIKVEVERLKREKEEVKEQVILEKEKEFSNKLKAEKEKIKKEADADSLLKIKELEKKLEDQTRLAEEMKRKAEQGSMQLQGEVQEIVLESILRDLYQFDDILEVKKGARGADILHSVRSNTGIVLGKIYYESKRTKDFNSGWLKKLKDDNLEVKADILVIVTESMPSDCEHNYLYKDGVWICSFREIKAFSMVLRQGIMQVHSVAVTHQGKETKMEMLYKYLTSNEFRGQFEAIIEGFKTLQDGYNDEKLKMQKIWKEREKQLDKILSNAVNFYGCLKGIAGASIPEIKMLE